MGRGCSVALGQWVWQLDLWSFHAWQKDKRRKVLWLLPLPPSPHACLHRKDSVFLLGNTEVTSLQFLSHYAQLGGVYLPEQGTSISGSTLSLLKGPTLAHHRAFWSLPQGRNDTSFSLVHSGSHRSWVDVVASLAVSTMSFSDWDYHYMYQKLKWILTQIWVCKVKKPEFWYGAWYYRIITLFNQFAFSWQLSAAYMKINWLKLALKHNSILVLGLLIKATWHH